MLSFRGMSAFAALSAGQFPIFLIANTPMTPKVYGSILHTGRSMEKTRGHGVKEGRRPVGTLEDSRGDHRQ